MKNVFTADELKTARCSQSDFGRLVGLSRARINQMIQSGLIPSDNNAGVKVVDALKIIAAWRIARKSYTLTVDEFFERFGDKI